MIPFINAKVSGLRDRMIRYRTRYFLSSEPVPYSLNPEEQAFGLAFRETSTNGGRAAWLLGHMMMSLFLGFMLGNLFCLRIPAANLAVVSLSLPISLVLYWFASVINQSRRSLVLDWNRQELRIERDQIGGGALPAAVCPESQAVFGRHPVALTHSHRSTLAWRGEALVVTIVDEAFPIAILQTSSAIDDYLRTTHPYIGRLPWIDGPELKKQAFLRATAAAQLRL